MIVDTFNEEVTVSTPPHRLYIVVDGSMPANTFAPQAVHAVTEFALADPEGFRKWHDEGNVCIILSEKDGKALARRSVEADRMGFKNFKFFEEDWKGWTPSAIAFLPDPDLQTWLSDLPLANPGGFFKERKRKETLRKRWARV